jgi:hypothetical protein
MAPRVVAYVRRLYRIAAGLALVGLILYLVQSAFHPFDAQIAAVEAFAAALDDKLSAQAFEGIKYGTLVLVIALCVFPIFLRKIDERAYARGLWRGIISAAVFYLSTELFSLAQGLGRIHLIVAVVAVALMTAIVVEGISLSVREEEEKSFRTDVVASIASGLLFGVLVKLGGYGIERLRELVAKPPA